MVNSFVNEGGGMRGPIITDLRVPWEPGMSPVLSQPKPPTPALFVDMYTLDAKGRDPTN